MRIIYHGNNNKEHWETLNNLYFSRMPYVEGMHNWLLKGIGGESKDDILLQTEIDSFKLGTEIDENITDGCWVGFEHNNSVLYGILDEYKEIGQDSMHKFELLKTKN